MDIWQIKVILSSYEDLSGTQPEKTEMDCLLVEYRDQVDDCRNPDGTWKGQEARLLKLRDRYLPDYKSGWDTAEKLIYTEGNHSLNKLLAEKDRRRKSPSFLLGYFDAIEDACYYDQDLLKKFIEDQKNSCEPDGKTFNWFDEGEE